MTAPDKELMTNIRKAMSSDENAPKQKHVRACILYTWDYKNGMAFWAGMKQQPILGDEVTTWKALVIVHKVVRGGHPNVLGEAIREMPWLEQLARSTAQMGNPYAYQQPSPVLGFSQNTRGGGVMQPGMDGVKGYLVIIRAYIQFLLAKLDYHRLHPDFNANFDYKEYTSLRRVEDPNQGYETIDDLLKLLDKLDALQRTIFASFRQGSNNECRVSALVPLVEESWGIYSFVKSMLTALHQRVEHPNILNPLRERFSGAHKRLFKFYSDAVQLRYLTSLISVPKIPPNPPEIFDSQAPGLPSRPRDPTPEPVQQLDERAVDLYEETSNQAPDPWLVQSQWQQHLNQVQTEAALREQNLRYQLEQEKWQEIQQLQQEIQQLQMLNSQNGQIVQMHEARSRELEQMMNAMSLQHVEQESRESYIAQLEEQLRTLRTKYEQLAKLYAQLRREHLELLSRLKEAKEADKKQVEQMREELEKSRLELRKSLQSSSQDRAQVDVLKAELERFKNSHDLTIQALERDLQHAKDALDDVSKAKGLEWEQMISKYEQERRDGEVRERELRNKVEQLQGELGTLNISISSERRSREEDESVLQASVDQALLALAQAQKRESEATARLSQEVKSNDTAWRTVMSRLLDGSFGSMENKLTSTWNSAKSGGLIINVTPAQVQQMVEKCDLTLQDMKSNYSRLTTDHVTGTQLGDAAPELITSSNNFVDSLVILVQGIASVVKEEGEVWNGTDNVVDAVSKWLNACKHLLDSPPHQEQVSQKLSELATILDQKLPRVDLLQDGDMDRQIDLEFSKAAKSIEEAAAKLQLLLPDDVLQGRQVDATIVDAAGAITASVANLIRSAGMCQQEIVAHEKKKGGDTSKTFYAKNKRWVEGLVSAARSVALATNLLVDSADGVVRQNPDRKMEELIVCCNEVNAATVQLVTAARVKALPMSKNQERLESAAKSVKSASGLLVGCVEQARGGGDSTIVQGNGDGWGAASYDYKKKEMATQVKILELERALEKERLELASMRKRAYKEAVEGGAALE